MKKLLFSAVIMLTVLAAGAQVHGTRTGHIHFFSSTKMENIEADNHSVNVVLQVKTGTLQFSAQVKSFAFEKALMQEHFNENYMESNTYPKADFKGKIDNIAAIDLTKDGTYQGKISGSLTMHGVTRAITADAQFVVAGGKISGESIFNVNPKDYNIAIPSAVVDKISENIAVTVKVNLDKMQ
jgi:polyisoprenoid-binding protein YceI